MKKKDTYINEELRLKANFKEKNPVSQETLNRLRKKIVFELEKENFKINKKIPLIRPVLALSLVSIMVIVTFWWYNHFNYTELKINNEVVSLEKSFNYKKNQAAEGKISDNLNLKIWEISNLKQKKNKEATWLLFDSGLIMASYDNKEKRNQLIVETPKATFKIVGTEFLINADNGNILLAVKSGQVSVNYQDKYQVIGKHQIWQDGGFVEDIQNPIRFWESIINESNQGQVLQILKLQKQNHSETITKILPNAKRVLIILKNGEKIPGEIKLNNEDFVIIKTKFADSLKISRSEIKEIRENE